MTGSVLLAYVGIVGLWPHVDASEQDTSEAQPLAAIFTATNGSPLPIYDIDVHCAVMDMEFTGNRGIGGVVLDGIPHSRSLGAYEPMDVIPCKIHAGNNVLLSADFFLVTCFKPKFGWWVDNSVTRFSTINVGGGRLKWLRNSPTASPVRNDIGDVVCGGKEISTLRMGPKAWLNFPAAQKIGRLPKK